MRSISIYNSNSYLLRCDPAARIPQEPGCDHHALLQREFRAFFLPTSVCSTVHGVSPDIECPHRVSIDEEDGPQVRTKNNRVNGVPGSRR